MPEQAAVSTSYRYEWADRSLSSSVTAIIPGVTTVRGHRYWGRWKTPGVIPRMMMQAIKVTASPTSGLGD